MDGVDAFEIAVRPRVPMPYVQALAGLAALAVCEQLGDDAQILWPSTVLLDGSEVAHAEVKAGYEDGIVARVTLGFAEHRDDRALLEQAILARIDAWELAVAQGRSAAGPYAQFAGDYFDCMAGMGQQVDLLFPNGSLYCVADLEGIDVWGRICVETADGRDTSYAPEQVSMRLRA